MSRDPYAELRRITDLMLEVELGRLRGEEERRQAIVARIGSLDTAVARQQAEIAAELDPEVSGRVLDRWGTWAERRRAALNTELAAQWARTETQADAARRAFGRAEALRLLSEAERAAARGRR